MWALIHYFGHLTFFFNVTRVVSFVITDNLTLILINCFYYFVFEISACQMLIETAAKLWQREEGDYRDDVSNLTHADQ